MRRMKMCHVVGLLMSLMCATVTSTISHRPCTHEFCEKQNAIFNWVESNGGVVNPKVEITAGTDPNWNVRGVFSTAAIESGETIFSIPPHLAMCRPDFCDLVSAFSHELSLGNSSFWWPYLALFEDQEIDLPYAWTREERELFSGLYPHEMATADFPFCAPLDETNTLHPLAEQWVGSRTTGDETTYCLIPLFDSVNHGQESQENSDLVEIEDGVHALVATKNISEKEQLFKTFGDNSFHYLFWHYGFFSQYPRLWVFEDEHGNKIGFKIFHKDGSYEFDFNPYHDPEPKSFSYIHLAIQHHLTSVLQSEPKAFQKNNTTISNSKRFGIALQYRKEYIEAFQMASDYVSHLVEKQENDELPCSHEFCEKQNAIFNWVKSNGGYVNPNVEITTGTDPTWNVRGVFTTAAIESGETIFSIPPHLAICKETYCDLVLTVLHELTLGNASFWWPYLSLMEGDKLDLSYTWTDEERNLLSGLYPSDLSTHKARDICEMIDTENELHLRALQLVGSRDVGSLDHFCIVPLFDSINHGQEGFVNSYLSGEYEEGFSVYTADDIAEQQQLLDSFGDNAFFRLFRDYGFFSQYPRLWVFEDEEGNEMRFKIYENDEGYDFDFNPDNVPHQWNMKFMLNAVNNHLSTVLDNQPLGLTKRSSTVSANRFKTSLSYRQEYINAFEMASHRLSQIVKENEEETVSWRPCTHEYCEKQKVIFEWVRSNGGYVNPKLELTQGPDPNWQIRGVFTTGTIHSDEHIFRIPQHLTLCGNTLCDIVASLSHELSLSNASFWWPYLSVMEDHELDLPYSWTDEERILLSGLYPRDLSTEKAQEICDNIDFSNEWNLRALQLAGSRSAGDDTLVCMIPLFDSINHAQEGFENAALGGHRSDGYVIFATDEIAEKGQLFDSFGDNSFSRLFRSYGFLSQYPRLFGFEDNFGIYFTFKIFENDGHYEFDFNPDDAPHQRNLIYMQGALLDHLSTVLSLEPLIFQQRRTSISSRRQNAAFEFRMEYIKAFKMASDNMLQLVETQKKDKILCSHEYCEKQNAIFNWVESNGGYVNPKVEITTGTDPTWNVRGVFATAEISQDELIFWVPPHLLLCGTTFCDTVAVLSRELSLGKSSFWWPYLSVMEDHHLDLPHTWTDEERDLLLGLYPNDLSSNAILSHCDSLDMNEKFNLRALQLVIARSVGDEGKTCMAPLFDSINHGQQGYENSAIGALDDGTSVYAIDDIEKDQQLFDSFGGNEFFRLFRDYGFLSQYPRLWLFEDDSGREISFKIFETNEGFDFDLNPNNESYQDDVYFMYNTVKSHLASILDAVPDGLKVRSPTVKEHRYSAALAFRHEYVNAFEMALNHLLSLLDEIEEHGEDGEETDRENDEYEDEEVEEPSDEL